MTDERNAQGRPRVDATGEAPPGQGTDPSSGDSPAQRASERAQLQRLFVDERLSERQIAERLGLSPATVHRRLKQHGITRGQPATRRREGIPLFEIPEGAETATYGFLAPGDLARVLRFTNEQIVAFNEGIRKEPVTALIETARMHLRQCGYGGRR
jgi:hypothetical protein